MSWDTNCVCCSKNHATGRREKQGVIGIFSGSQRDPRLSELPSLGLHKHLESHCSLALQIALVELVLVVPSKAAWLAPEYRLRSPLEP